MRAISRRAAVFATFTLATAVACAAGPEPGSLEAAQAALGAGELRSIEFTGKGRWFQFGQAPSPTLPWPRFDVTSYTATIDYAAPAARIQMVRTQTVEPGRARPAPVEQRPDAYVSGTAAWNMPPAGSPSPDAQPQPAAVEERVMEIWTTPHGFLKAAAANGATSRIADGGHEVTFTVGGRHRYVGKINPQNQVERVQTWIDNPVLGDTPVEIVYSDYRDFNGVMFPGTIVRTQGGYPVLDITVSSVARNPAVDLPVPEPVRSFTPPPVTATAEKLSDGVWYIKGGGHHSVAIEQKDHIVVVEGPLDEARSMAVIAKVKETIPNKPIKSVINTHVHFDHSGGLRTYAAEGATIVTHDLNKPYYEKAWAAPRTINPDKLAQANKPATFETFTDKHVIADASRPIEIYPIEGSGHNDAFAMIYLPKEKILMEVDAWAPLAPNQTPPAAPSPFAINLYDNIQKLKLDVRQVAALHGPRVASLEELKAALKQGAPNTTTH
jgi:glyoxylase-like metal-dependent hydrolase (beta-lactamase superfamily II)